MNSVPAQAGTPAPRLRAITGIGYGGGPQCYPEYESPTLSKIVYGRD